MDLALQPQSQHPTGQGRRPGGQAEGQQEQVEPVVVEEGPHIPL